MSTYKRGDKWWIRFRFNHQRYFKCSPDNSRAGAMAYEALLRQRLARGEPINGLTIRNNKVKTFEEFSIEWLDSYVKTNNKTSEVKNKQSVLRVHLLPFFGKMPLNKISALDIEKFKAEKIKAGLSNKSINNFLIIIGKCLKTAIEWEVIDKTPKIKQLTIQKQKYDFLTEQELTILISHSQGITKDMIIVASRTGLRFGELIALEWQNLDLNSLEPKITVEKAISRGVLGSPKSNKIRYIPIINDVFRMLAPQQQNKGLVFANNQGSYLSQQTCINRLHQVCKKAKMRKIGWHTLRHTFASQLAQNGVSITFVRELLGHSDIRTTMRYSHLTPLAVRDAINTLDGKSGYIVETISNLEYKDVITLTPNKYSINKKPAFTGTCGERGIRTLDRS